MIIINFGIWFGLQLLIQLIGMLALFLGFPYHDCRTKLALNPLWILPTGGG
jgi:hypothetical protein